MLERESEVFTFTEAGRVKFWEQGQERGVMLAESHGLAYEFAQWLRDKKGADVEVSEVGRAPGETLESYLNTSRKHGANCAFLIKAIDGDKVEFDTLEPST